MRTPKDFQDSRKESIMSNSLPGKTAAQRGFTLLELMVALVVTLVITGSMYGLIASGQGAFRREPALIDRQQQIRIAMSRIQGDVVNSGIGLGTFIQAFGENLGGLGMLGVRVLGDANLGGGKSDFLEIRQQTPDCPTVRIDPVKPTSGSNYLAIEGWPACYPEPGWVVAFYPDGNAKRGWGHNQHGSGDSKVNFPSGQQPDGSQLEGVSNLTCSIDENVFGPCPGANVQAAVLFAQLDQIRYQLGNDTDGVPSLFRSTTGGLSGTAGDTNKPTLTNPPGAAWQLIARGIEDMQIRYRTFAGWQNAAPLISPLAGQPYDNIVREVEITLWARTVGERLLQGETAAAGNGVTAVRGSMTTSVSPRAAQMALASEPNPAKRWQ